MPGATVYFPDLKTGAATNPDGKYVVKNLPGGRFLVQVKLIGYGTHTEVIDLNATTEKDFTLKESVVEVREVIVTGVSQATEKDRTPTPISIVPKTVLLQTSSTNIIDVISSQPGISQVTTGSGISKPVIRGLGYNRVLVVNDGIRQEGQQWGDEHGIEVDEYSISQVEILKGPASLSYGSDAMAGVIHLISTPSMEDGKHGGGILANYQTNNGLLGYSGNASGNLNGFIYNLRFSQKQAHDYKNKYDGYVHNSGFSESSLSAITGINRKWGFTHLHASSYHITPGIVEGERDSLTGGFLKQVALNDSVYSTNALFNDHFKYKPVVPYQDVSHYKLVSVSSFIVGDGRISTTVGYQRNQRKEFVDAALSEEYELFFDLSTVNYDVKYILPEEYGIQSSIGINGMYQSSANLGTEFLVPEYNLFDAGLFAIARKSYEKLDLSGGLRYDQRSQTLDALFLDSNGVRVQGEDGNATQKFASSDNLFRGVSGSFGLSYKLSETMFSKLNFSRGFRAPNIAELGANGIHEGTLRYEIGNPELKPENSLQTDFAFGVNGGHVTAEISLFNNIINNFIFPVKLSGADGQDSITEGSSTFKYISGNAVLNGGELIIDIHPHPLDWMHIQNTFSYVAAYQPGQPDSTRNLPGIPPARYQPEIIISAGKAGKWIRNPYVQIGAQVYFSQDKIFSAYGTETSTLSYCLFNAGAGGDIVINGKTRASVYIAASNITDAAYQSHLSRLKYAPVNYATGRNGVFNMGRNISFRVIVPFGFSSKG